ncbi:MAG TPA: sigma-70 family RNA polymerase sigma factor [Acidimicrobiia bacterium]|nr:sigma-70 family RNA polymerase sigma factor [Acidimicrobiia bacterium]
MPAERAFAATDGDGAAIADLHVTYAATRDPHVRDALLAYHDRLALRLARGFPTRREETADLVQVARIGLILALDRFDPNRGRPFSVFARATIVGELKRHLRDRAWPVRVSRTLKEHSLIVGRVGDDLTQELRRAPDPGEIAERAGLTERDVRDVMVLSSATLFTRLDDRGAAGGPARDIPAEDPAFARVETERTLSAVLAGLPPRQRATLQLRFELGLSQADIADRLGVTQMSVSRGLQRVLTGLRGRISADGEGWTP